MKDVLIPPMLSKAKVKNDQGFYHQISKNTSVCPFVFYSCIVLKFHLRTIEAIHTGMLAVTAQLLPSFLFPDDHVYDSNDISLNVLQGHIMIRIFVVMFSSYFSDNFL